MAAEKERQGMQSPFTGTSFLNQLDFIIERKIKEMVNTSAIVSIDGADAKGHDSGSGNVSATPMVAQTDAQGNALPMASLPQLRPFRYGAGCAAFICDPVGGDKAVAVFQKSDSSTVNEGTTQSQRPGSFRSFSQADGVTIPVLTKTPTVWIELKQDNKCIIHAPEGVTIETDKTVEIKAGEGVIIDTPQTTITGNLTATGEKGSNIAMTGTVNLQGDMTQTGSITSSGDHVAGGISQVNHTHTGVEPGGGNTGKPE